MYFFQQFLLALGGIALFLLGLKYMSENMEMLAGEKMQNLLAGVTKNKFLGVLTGAFSTAIIQSSIATNVIVVGFVSQGIMTFYQASAVIMGANIGTTVTAQLVSLSGKNAFDITAIGSLIAFIGFFVSLIKKGKCSEIGGVMTGFGILFLGLDIVNDGVSYFKNFDAFRRFFLVEGDVLLILNGLMITAILQSSSAVTSVMIILASNGLLTFESSMFLILGANIGTCFSVIVASLNKPLDARRAAFFNFAFNFVGTLVLYLPLHIFKAPTASAFAVFSGGIERQIANFHTLYNCVVTIILLPLLKPFTNLITLIVKDSSKKGKHTWVEISKNQPKSNLAS